MGRTWDAGGITVDLAYNPMNPGLPALTNDWSILHSVGYFFENPHER